MNDRVKTLHVSSSAVPQGSVNVQDQGKADFKLASRTLSTSVPAMKAALVALHERWPETIPFEELVDESLRRLGLDPATPQAQRPKHSAFLAENLIECLAQQTIQLFTVPPRMQRRPGDRPRGFSVARYQVEAPAPVHPLQKAPAKPMVTSLFHELVSPSDFDRQILQLADGQRTRDEIIDVLVGHVHEGKLKPSVSFEDTTQLRAALSTAVDDSLNRLSRVGLMERESE
jgi:methyltransferase-like protein